jgi:hypothetical protein
MGRMPAHGPDRGWWRTSRPMGQITAGGADSRRTWRRDQGADGGWWWGIPPDWTWSFGLSSGISFRNHQCSSIVVKYNNFANSNNITFWGLNDRKSQMRPFEANGTAGGLCGQCVSRELVRYDETRPRNVPLQCQRVRISPGHEAVVPRGTISRLTFW